MGTWSAKESSVAAGTEQPGKAVVRQTLKPLPTDHATHTITNASTTKHQTTKLPILTRFHQLHTCSSASTRPQNPDPEQTAETKSSNASNTRAKSLSGLTSSSSSSFQQPTQTSQPPPQASCGIHPLLQHRVQTPTTREFSSPYGSNYMRLRGTCMGWTGSHCVNTSTHSSQDSRATVWHWEKSASWIHARSCSDGRTCGVSLARARRTMAR
ncbi:hypothetical protein BC830DRAFT_299925 [Chytriomyces sp. MP71]|nr:hypothetical protein BC830DRAFT_299925 [Chytriomyces sp. MP71]